jgi:hypothetical protein
MPMPNTEESLELLREQLTNPFLTEGEVRLIERKIALIKTLND